MIGSNFLNRLFNQLHKICYSDIEVTSQLSDNVELNVLLNIPFNVIDYSLDESVSTK
jgi:hypothetical protein